MFKQSLLSGGIKGPQLFINDKNFVEQNSDHKDPRFTPTEIAIARAAKMTGERSQLPSWRCVRKTIIRMRNKMGTKGSWRSWPKENFNAV